jgi:hypothetical protein
VTQTLADFESDWALWLTGVAPGSFTRRMAEHHAEFWDWVWNIRQGARPRPFVAVWSRGHAKSTSAEAAVVALGARGRRRYGLYVSETQEQADDHVASAAGMLEGARFAALYPTHAQRALGKFGQSKGWRRQRLRTAGGFTLDALGLDTAARGIKIDEDRPDLVVLDDLDSDTDTPVATARKIKMLSRKILPAATPDAAVVAVQNLVAPESMFAKLVRRELDVLADAIISGPIPAVRGLVYEQQGARTILTGGEPTWPGMGLAECQQEVDKSGISAFLSEHQHEVDAAPGGMYDHLSFVHCRPEDVPKLDVAVCWVDPAVTATDESDSNGIQIDGVGRGRTIYRLYSWEKRSTPRETLEKALIEAQRYGCSWVGIETDQGGDTWESVYREAMASTGVRLPMHSDKAGAGHGSKVHRSQQMLSDYERADPDDPAAALIIHVEGTHHVLERSLRRFPRTAPFDLADAAYWSWQDLRRIRPVRFGRVPMVAVAQGNLPRLTP